MARKKKTPSWVIPAALVAGAIALFAKSAGAQSAKKPASTVQTATVGNRVYSVSRLGQGTYLVSLVSTGGVLETSPVTFTFNQTGPMGDFGDQSKVAQLKADLNSMQLDFKS